MQNLNYNDIYREYEDFKSKVPTTQLTIEQFAQEKDKLDGTPGLRQQAYDASRGRKIAAGWGRMVESTQLPLLGESVGRSLGQLAGASEGVEDVLGEIGRTGPELLIEGTATAPLGGVGLWSRLAKVAGYTGAGLQGWNETDTPLGGAINAGTMGAANYLMPRVGNAAYSAVANRIEKSLPQFVAPDVAAPLSRSATELVREANPSLRYLNDLGAAPTVAKVGAELGTTVGLNEGSRQATMSAMGVPLFDEQRDPFTTEAVVGNLAGVIPMAPALTASFINRPKINLTQAKALSDWLGKREEFVRTTTIKKDIDAAPPQRLDIEMVTSQLAAIEQATRDGRADVATKLKQNLAKLMSDIPDQSSIGQKADNIETISRMATPQTPAELQRFIGDVNGVISQWNSLRTEVPKLQQQIENAGYAVSKVRDGYVLKKDGVPVSDMNKVPQEVLASFENYQQAASLSENARDAQVVGQLQREGYIEPITPEWLKEQFNFSFDRSLGDYEFAWKAVVQKAANKVVDQIPLALRARESQAKAQSLSSPRQQIENVYETAYIDSLIRLPRILRDSIAMRGIEMQQNLQDKGGDFEMGRRMRSLYNNYRQAVIDAGQTYNPETGTIKLNGVEQPADILFERRPGKSEYVWYPKPTSSFLGNENARTVPLETQKFNEPSSDLSADDSVGIATEGRLGEGTQTASDYNIPDYVPGNETTFIRDTSQALVNRLEELSPQGLWNAVQDMYVRTSPKGLPIADSMNSFRRRNFKLALDAAIEHYSAANTNEIGPKGKEFLDTYLQERPAYRKKFDSDRKEVFQLLGDFFGGKNTFERLPGIIERVLGKTQRMETGEPMQVYRQRISGEMTGRAPEQDLALLARDYFYRLFGNYGISGEMRDFYTEIAAAAAAQLKGVDIRVFTTSDPNTAGKVGVRTDGNSKFAMNMEAHNGNRSTLYDATQVADRVIQTILHELSHVDSAIRQGIIRRPDAYSEERLQHLENMHRVARMLSPVERDAIIRTYLEGTSPPKYRSFESTETSRPDLAYGSLSEEEFVARILEITDKTLLRNANPLQRKTDVWNVLDYLLPEVTQFIRGRARALGDIVETLQEFASDPQYRNAALSKRFWQGKPVDFSTTAAASPRIGQALRTVVESARAASRFRNYDIALAQGKQLLAGLEQVGSFEPSSLPVWNDEPITGERVNYSRINKAIDENIREPWFGSSQDKQGIFTKLYPFSNMLQRMDRAGVPLARDVDKLARSIKAAVNKGIAHVWEPFLVRDEAGRPTFDKESALVQKIKKDKNGRWREVLNKVRAIQNMKKGQSMFLEESGQIKVNPEFQSEWSALRERGRLSSFDEQVVMNTSVSLDKAAQNAASLMVSGLRNSTINRTAMLLMTLDRNVAYDKTRLLAAEVVESFFNGTQQQVLTKLQPAQAEAVSSLLSGADGLIEGVNKVQQALAARPGHSTETLPYDWIIRYVTKDNELKFLSAPTKKGAFKLAKRLEQDGSRIDGQIIDRKSIGNYSEFDAPDDILQKFIDTENRTWDKFASSLEAKYGPEIGQDLRAYSAGAETMKELEKRGLGKFLAEQSGKIDRAKYDYLEGFEKWVPRVVASVQYRSVRQQLGLILRDPRVRGFPEFQKTVRDQFDYIFSPTSAWANEMSSALGAYFLGGNLSSALVELTQGPSVLVPVLINNDTSGGGVIKAYKNFFSAVKATTLKYATKTDWAGNAKRLKLENAKNWSLDDTLDYAYARAVAEGTVDHGIVQDIAYNRDVGTLDNTSFGTGKYTPTTNGQLALDMAYIGSQHLMKLYSWSALFNNKVGFIAGARQAYQNGLRGSEVYDYALRIKDLSQFSGGKANAPGFMGQEMGTGMRNAFTVMRTLQQYGFGVFSTYAEMARDAVGRNTNLTPGQRLQARKALGTMMITQTAVAGVFGLPFAAAAMTALEKLFGIEANRAVREGLSSLGKSMSWDDDEEGRTAFGNSFADFVLTGAGNQLFGIDLSSRAGVSNLMGASPYEGFNIMDMLGPAPSVVTNMLDGIGYAAQGQGRKAIHSLAPQAFKNVIQLSDTKAKYGDFGFRDKSENLIYQPSYGQVVAYAMGFRPAEVSAYRKAQGMMITSENNAKRRRDQMYDSAAQALVRGDPSEAQRLGRDLMQADPMMSMQDFYRSILQRATAATSPKDPMRTGMRENAENRLQISQLFDESVLPQISEVELTQQRAQLAANMGMPTLVRGQDFVRAAKIDALVKNGRMSRSQAVALLEFLN